MAGTVGILGSGIAGLATAYYLAKLGHRPRVLDVFSSRKGRSTARTPRESEIDLHAHWIPRADTALCGLLADLGGMHRVAWRPTTPALALDGQIHPLRKTSDLLAIPSLSPRGRLRGMLGLSYATSGRLYALDLDRVQAVEWLPRVVGREVFEQIYLPTLSSRFGEYVDEVSAYAVWHRLSQSLRTGRQHVAGFLRGGSPWLEDALIRAIEALGGAVVSHSDISGIEYGRRGACIEVDGREEFFDAIVSTAPDTYLTKIARGHLLKVLPATNVTYQSRITAVAICSKRTGPYLSADIVDEGLPFHLVEETFLPGEKGSSSTSRLVYLTRFCGEHTEAYKSSDEIIAAQARNCLERIHPELCPDDIQSIRVSRAPDADPIHSLGYLSRKPSSRVGQTSIFTCTAAQAYPKPYGWNTSVMLAREVVALVARHLD